MSDFPNYQGNKSKSQKSNHCIYNEDMKQLPTINYWKCYTGWVNIILVLIMLWWKIILLIELIMATKERIFNLSYSIMFMSENTSPPPLSPLILLAQHILSGEIPWHVMTLFIVTMSTFLSQPSLSIGRRLQEHNHFHQSRPDCTKFNGHTAKWCALIFIRFQSRELKCLQVKFMWMRCN